MEKLDKQPRRAYSKKEKIEYLLNRAAEQGLESLTVTQWDFLVDNNVDVDNLVLTPQQKQAAKALTRAERPSGLQYKKDNYADSRKRVFDLITELLMNNADVVTEPPRKNYRDIEFVIGGERYGIIMEHRKKSKLEKQHNVTELQFPY